MSTSSVRRLEGVALHPIQDERGVWRFDAAELNTVAIPSRRQVPTRRTVRNSGPGEIAARVFRLVERGYGLREIVLRTRQPPDVIRRLYREWLVDLREGEQLRRQKAARDRERREMLEDERLHLERMKTLG